MFIRHHLAKGFNDIPLRDLRFATEHTERAGEVAHVGWKILGEYAGDSERSKKHRYEIVFSLDELDLFLSKGESLRRNFDSNTILLFVTGGAADADEVEDDAPERASGGDEGE